ncbi:hypothetical protein Nepgr_002095 [Nepenthes gracilis]|uniref:DEK-C domain-containing protein n=1 Tax=Nepenthes gracilis TaxID=150966 RepID=A0AAD3P696_NEPGR|nr:hypothetical protein Nepgr_002095 [Nepenthes gracilis]
MSSEGQVGEKASGIDVEVRAAMLFRVPYFREKADTLTFEGVRRVLEKDLGLEIYALDVHKRFVKQCLQECLEADNDDQVTTNSADAGKKAASLIEGKEELAKELKPKKEAKEAINGDGETMEDSPVFGLMTGHEKAKREIKETQDTENTVVPSEAMIKKAISKRASYFRVNSENVTMAGVRRLLEEDLKLEKYTLDPFKKFINEQVTEVLTSREISKSATRDKKADPKKSSKAPTKSSKVTESDSDDLEEDVKARKKTAPEGKTQSPAGLKKRKRAEEDTNELRRKQSEASKTRSEESSDAEDGGDISEDGESRSAKKPANKEVVKPSFGKRVEHLKSVIKSCGMSVSPSVYRKVKQAPENAREASLIKELQEILSKEGLSTDPSEKEIKEVRKRKERTKELEGIDLSNIVSTSRRRSATSFSPPPKPIISVESDAESGDSDNDDDNEDEEEEEEEVDEEQDNEEDGDDDSQSEEDAEDSDDTD